MPIQDVLAPPATRKERADREFATLFASLFPPLAHAVHRVVADRAVAEQITQEAFLELFVHWRRVTRSEPPDEWVHRLALHEAERTGVVGTDARPADVAAWEERRDSVYAAVLAVAARRRSRRRTVLAGGAVVIALAVAAVAASGAESPTPPVQPALAPPPWVTGWAGHSPGTVLDGRWETGLLTRADVANALQRAGLAEYADHARTFPPGRFRIQMLVDGGKSVLTVGTHRDVRNLRVARHRVTLEAPAPNVEVEHLRWHGQGPWLTLSYIGRGLTKHDVPGSQVHLIALYTTARFQRA
jgi:hypothetical protein